MSASIARRRVVKIDASGAPRVEIEDYDTGTGERVPTGWARRPADDRGRFTLPDGRPGRYVRPATLPGGW